MTTYNVEIVVNGKGNAGGFFNSTGSALSRMGEIAGGIIGAQIFTKIASGIMSAGQEALASYASYERLGMSLQSLSARELLNSGAAKNMTDAMSMAKGMSEELLGWVQKLAIQSPFQQEQVAGAFRMAMAYGFTTDEAKRLTQATIDFASGSGASSAAMDKIALALGQIKAKGKLAGGEMLQLTEAGLDVRGILSKAFGVTTEKLVEMQEKGLIPADKAIEAIVSSLENDFGGAAKAQSATFSGLISSLEDIKSVGLREFFTGTFKTIQPYVAKFVDTLSSDAFIGRLREMGTVFGESVGKLISKLSMFNNMVERGVAPVDAFFRTLKAWTGLNLAPLFEQVRPHLVGFADGVTKAIDTIKGMDLSEIPAKIGQVFAGLAGTGIAGLAGAFSISKIMAVIGPKIPALGAALSNAFSVLGRSLFSGLLVGLSKLSPAIGGAFFKMFMTGGIAEKIGSAFGGIFGKIGGVAGKFLAPLLSIFGGLAPIVLIAVAALTAFGVVTKAMQGDTAFFARLWDRVQVAFGRLKVAWDAIAPVLMEQGKKIFSAIQDAGVSLAEKVLPWLVTKFETLAQWFVANGPLINTFIEGLSAGFTNVILPAIVNAWAVIQPILDGLFAIIGNVATLVLQLATGDWAGAWVSISNVVTIAATTVMTTLQNLWTWVVGIFQSLSDVLVGHSIVPDMMAAIYKVISDYVNKTIAFWRNGFNALLTATVAAVLQISQRIIVWCAEIITQIVTFAASLLTAWNNAWDALITGLATIGSSLLTAIGSLFSTLITDLTAENGPLKGFLDIGPKIIEYMKQGISDNWTAFVTWVGEKIKEIIKSLLPGGGTTPVAPQRFAPQSQSTGFGGGGVDPFNPPMLARAGAGAGGGRTNNYYFGGVKVYQTVKPQTGRNLLKDME